jgi:hypothetical protein
MRRALACGLVLSAVLIVACGSSGGHASGAPTAAQGVAFARCMRAHGLTGFPDPITGHSFQFNLPAGMNPASPAFKTAGRACRKLSPRPPGGGGGVPSSVQAAGLEHADCMRSHGVPNYPDPTYFHGRPTERPLSNYGIDDQSPAFLSAAKACGGE